MSQAQRPKKIGGIRFVDTVRREHDRAEATARTSTLSIIHGRAAQTRRAAIATVVVLLATVPAGVARATGPGPQPAPAATSTPSPDAAPSAQPTTPTAQPRDVPTHSVATHSTPSRASAPVRRPAETSRPAVSGTPAPAKPTPRRASRPHTIRKIKARPIRHRHGARAHAAARAPAPTRAVVSQAAPRRHDGVRLALGALLLLVLVAASLTSLRWLTRLHREMTGSAA